MANLELSEEGVLQAPTAALRQEVERVLAQEAGVLGWRLECSAVTAVKEAYRGASKRQRQQIRAWMRRVLSDEDGNDRAAPAIRRQRSPEENRLSAQRGAALADEARRKGGSR